MLFRSGLEQFCLQFQAEMEHQSKLAKIITRECHLAELHAVVEAAKTSWKAGGRAKLNDAIAKYNAAVKRDGGKE